MNKSDWFGAAPAAAPLAAGARAAQYLPRRSAFARGGERAGAISRGEQTECR